MTEDKNKVVGSSLDPEHQEKLEKIKNEGMHGNDSNTIRVCIVRTYNQMFGDDNGKA